MISLREIYYDRAGAVSYAFRWARSRNPAYYDFDALGGDCTNFASQCVYAGCGVMNGTPDIGWYYYGLNSRSPSWTGVEFFYDFMTRNKSAGPYGRETPLSSAEPGDIIQLGGEGGFYHSLVVLTADGGEIYIAAHTGDALMRPLSSYVYARARCIHIAGARK